MQSKGMAPAKIEGKRMVFYTTIVASTARDVDRYHKDYLLEFETNGTYEGRLQGGSDLDRGDYSYSLTDTPNQARLILTYSLSNTNYTYAHLLTFQTPKSGIWVKEKSTDPESSEQEGGTFKILN
jgi:hypothetical protein